MLVLVFNYSTCCRHPYPEEDSWQMIALKMQVVKQEYFRFYLLQTDSVTKRFYKALINQSVQTFFCIWNEPTVKQNKGNRIQFVIWKHFDFRTKFLNQLLCSSSTTIFIILLSLLELALLLFVVQSDLRTFLKSVFRGIC